jgi:hypothetical protein
LGVGAGRRRWKDCRIEGEGYRELIFGVCEADHSIVFVPPGFIEVDQMTLNISFTA